MQALLGKIADVLQDPLQRGNLEPVTPKHLKTTGIFGQYNLAADLMACRHCYKSRCYTDFSIPKKSGASDVEAVAVGHVCTVAPTASCGRGDAIPTNPAHAGLAGTRRLRQ
ncbi:MAG: hypothetical protein HPY82_00485 [Gammaproteobacteria bacterium]|nr:hypothetical protein [Gammaproteobacteria bacterium]